MTGAKNEDRLQVAKTYKLFIDGAFPRSESGRTFPVHGPDGTLLANAAQASRKDLRDAVNAALKHWLGSEDHLATVKPFGFDQSNITDKTAAELCAQ